MRKILPAIITFFTKKARYFPVVEWSKNSWTHNVFRVFEIVFGKEVGVRFEGGTYRDENGEITVFFGTIEAAVAFFESSLRARIARIPRPYLRKVYIPIFAPAYAGPMPSLPSPYLFAIAYNAVTVSSGYSQSTGFTLSHTTSGSDRALVGVFQYGGATPATQFTSIAMTYNSVSMTGNSGANITAGNRGTAVFAQMNPTTGANNLATTWSGGGTEDRLFALSYTGVHQTTGLDTWGENSTSSGTSLTVSVTTTVANCMLVGGIFVREGGLGDLTITSGNVRSQDQTTGAGDKSVASSGSNSMVWNFASGAAGSGTTAALVALAPTAGTDYTTTLSESQTASDDMLAGPARTLSESKTATDDLLATPARTLSESQTPTDTFASAFIILETLSEAVTAVDSIIRSGIRVLADSVTATATFIQESVKNLLDSITASDTFTSVLSYGRILTESVGATDIIRKVLNGNTTFWTSLTKTIGSWTDRDKI